MTQNLHAASRQWADRPDDERFSSLEDMLAATKHFHDQASEAVIPFDTLRVEAADDEVQLLGRTGKPAKFSHYAFTQFAQHAHAPADYLRTLPATLACQNLNHGLKAHAGDKFDARLLFHQNGGLLLRAVSSELYQRIWNYELVERLIPMQEKGWRVPPARPARAGQAGTRQATEDDVLQVRDGGGGLSINVGDLIAPAGLYASDRDMFVFMINEENRINDGTSAGLSRGFFMESTEVQVGKAWKMTMFLLRHACGNHICWCTQNVMELTVKHIGHGRDRAFHNLVIEAKKYAESSAQDEERKVIAAKRFTIGGTKDEVIDKLFSMRIQALGRRKLEAAYDLAEENVDTDGAPSSAWGMAQGITRLSQESPHMSERTALDRAAGKVMQIAF